MYMLNRLVVKFEASRALIQLTTSGKTQRRSRFVISLLADLAFLVKLIAVEVILYQRIYLELLIIKLLRVCHHRSLITVLHHMQKM